jgi:hypothetical protein
MTTIEDTKGVVSIKFIARNIFHKPRPTLRGGALSPRWRLSPAKELRTTGRSGRRAWALPAALIAWIPDAGGLCRDHRRNRLQRYAIWKLRVTAGCFHPANGRSGRLSDACNAMINNHRGGADRRRCALFAGAPRMSGAWPPSQLDHAKIRIFDGGATNALAPAMSKGGANRYPWTFVAPSAISVVSSSSLSTPSTTQSKPIS